MRIAIIGGGVGGLTLLAALQRIGKDAVVYERAAEFGQVGADINLTPNSVGALAGLGLQGRLADLAARPTHRISRTWDDGTETSRLPMDDEAERRYGHPQLTLHRADLLATLRDVVGSDSIMLGKRLTGLDATSAQAQLTFDDGSTEAAGIVIGADGIHSAVRTSLFGAESPTFTGIVSYRAVIPREKVAALPNSRAFVKWWGPEPATQIVTFPLGKDNVFVFATTPQSSWTEESWTSPGDPDELREHYRDFHPDARALLEPVEEVTKSALYVRDPLAQWTQGSVTLLGDAAHPMTPFMAQGAGQAIEDAVVLSRCLSEVVGDGDASAALATYESTRKERTSRVQLASRGNDWMRTQGSADWLYGYDAWGVDLNRVSGSATDA